MENEHHHEHEHNHDATSESSTVQYLPSVLVFSLLVIGIALDYFGTFPWFQGTIRLVWYGFAYFIVGFPVLKESYESLKKGSFFTEFTLMGVATIGAFIIGEYPEGVAVMLFYAIGELFQDAAVSKAKKNIKALLDIRPDCASVFKNNQYITLHPENVNIGDKIQIKAGEKVPLDGILLSVKSNFNTAALTGESKPKSYTKGASILAGMINLEQVIEVEVTKRYEDSAVSKILELVQNATAKKARTELLIRKFAKIYTPIVFGLAVLVCLLPALFLSTFDFTTWLYRALIFLVISCPCALVISIPLGYFGGIGAASRHGILFKGSNYLDSITKVNTLVMDKTGTLTEGVFTIKDTHIKDIEPQVFWNFLISLEQKSTHPIAKAIINFKETISPYEAVNVEEIEGHGLQGMINNQQVVAGNTKLFKKLGITYDHDIDTIVETTVVVAINNNYVGYITIADNLKDSIKETIQRLYQLGITKTIILSGDKDSITQKIAFEIGVNEAYGDLLPEGKVALLENLKKIPESIVAFVGDGINDAPVLALSDVGIAMGALGSDVAIETADVVLQNDQLSSLVTALKIGHATRKIVIQNIVLAFVVKIIVLLLGAGGLATMWEAVIADVGVALLAILNAVRIQKMHFN
jgi:Cd2+/Zn2+-exporting ATPase